MTSYTALIKKYGGQRAASRATGIPRTTLQHRANSEAARETVHHKLDQERVVKLTASPKKYIFTAAVAGTTIHKDFFDNLKAYAKSIKAELVVGPLGNTLRQRYQVTDTTKFADELVMYLMDAPLALGDRIKFCPELKLTPTMVKPLQGLQTYTKALWSIFPHPKVCMDAVATHKHSPAKMMYTTGCVTHPSYSASKAGYRAHFDHMYGALIVEVTKAGTWVRQLSPTSDTDGSFFDLQYHVSQGKVRRSTQGVLALIYGDIHVEKLCETVANMTWGKGGLASVLKPETQVFHDLKDMSAENYHELDDIFSRCKAHAAGETDVLRGFNQSFEFMRNVRKYAKTNIVVESNHDYFVKKWLIKYNPDKGDFLNIIPFYRLKFAVVESSLSGEKVSVLEQALRAVADLDMQHVIDDFTFLCADDSLFIADIECGWHGHFGPNGSRGNRTSFKFVTEKSTIGHMHSPGIESGCHVVGTSSALDLGYNRGPSSWANAHGVIYNNKARAILVMSDGKFYADQVL